MVELILAVNGQYGTKVTPDQAPPDLWEPLKVPSSSQLHPHPTPTGREVAHGAASMPRLPWKVGGTKGTLCPSQQLPWGPSSACDLGHTLTSPCHQVCWEVAPSSFPSFVLWDPILECAQSVISGVGIISAVLRAAKSGSFSIHSGANFALTSKFQIHHQKLQGHKVLSG